MKPGAGQHPESSDREVLAGLVERVTFHNPENGFCVLRTKARGHRDLVTVVGHAAMVGPGEWITASAHADGLPAQRDPDAALGGRRPQGSRVAASRYQNWRAHGAALTRRGERAGSPSPAQKTTPG